MPINLSDPVQREHPLNRGLVSWWLPLRHNYGSYTLFDIAGKNHGTLTNGPAWTVGPNGFASLQFDGSDDHVELNGVALLDASSPFTVEFDVHMGDGNSNTLATFSTGSLGVFFGYVNFGGGYQGWSLGDVSWQPQQDGRTGRGNARYHVVYTYNGAGVGTASNYQIYENGIAGAVVNASPYGANGAVSRIGWHVGTDDWLGQIHSVRLSNRAASVADVGRLYEQSLRGYPNTLRRLDNSYTRSLAAAAPDRNLLPVSASPARAAVGGPGRVVASEPVDRSHPLNRALVRWWLPLPNNQGGQTLFDIVGRNNGTLTNGPTWAAGPSGFGVVRFDGSDDHASGTATPTTATDDLFVEAVICPTAIPQAGHFFSCGDNGGSAGGFGLSIAGTSFGNSGDRLTILFPGVAWRNFTYTFPAAERWYHVVVGRTSGTWRAWVNGAEDATTFADTPGAAQARWAIGARNYGSTDHWFTGRIGSVKLANTGPSAAIAVSLYDQYLRGYPDLLRRASEVVPYDTPTSDVALNALPIRVSTGGPGLVVAASPVRRGHPLNRGLLSWWLPLPNNQGGQTLFDVAGKNHGTLTNGPTWGIGPNGFGVIQCASGASSYAALPDLSTYDGSAVASVEFVLRRTNTAPGSDPTSGCFRFRADDANGNAHYPYVDGNLYLGVFNGNSVGRPISGFSDSGFDKRAWHHLLIVNRGTGGSDYRVYRNGVLLTSGTGLASCTFGTAPYLGNSRVASPLPGDLDFQSCRLYPARALSDADAAVLYEQSLRGYPDLLDRDPSYGPFPYASAGSGTAYTLGVDQGAYTLSGQSVVTRAAALVAAGQGAYTLSGQDAGVKAGHAVAAGQGSYTLDGQATGLTAAIRVAIGQGTYAVAGQALGLLANRLIAIGQGSYSLSGQSAGLLAGRSLTADQGTYTLAGQAIGLRTAANILAGQGAYSLSGQDVQFVNGQTLPLAQGTYTLSGQAVGVRADADVLMGQGAYSLSGQVVGVAAGRPVVMGQGAYALSGQVVGLVAAHKILMGQGDYSLAGQDMTFQSGEQLAMGQGAYALSGQVVGLRVGVAVLAGQGGYSLAGQVLSVSAGRLISIGQGTYSLVGQNVGSVAGLRIAAAQGTYSLAGQSVATNAGRRIVIDQGSYSFAGQSVSPTTARLIQLSRGTYTLAGQSVVLLDSGGAVSEPILVIIF